MKQKNAMRRQKRLGKRLIDGEERPDVVLS